MNDYEKDYSTYNSSKIEYATTESGSYTKINGCVSVPDIGGEPSDVDTTTLDNTEYETSMYGLKPAQKFAFEFNMDNKSATSNIKVVSDMEDSGNYYFFKYTLPTGVTMTFKSKVRTTIKGGKSNELVGFTMHLSPQGEVTKTIATQ